MAADAEGHFLQESYRAALLLSPFAEDRYGRLCR